MTKTPSGRLTAVVPQRALPGARVVLQGHQPLAGAVKVLREIYSHLYNGGNPAELKSKIASNEEMDKMTHNAQYKEWIKTFMK